MNHYKHFTLKEREMIKHYIDIGKNQSEIALLLKRNKSSISRELIRNNINGEYLPCDVQSSYLQRRLCCKPKKKLDNQIVYKCVKNLFLNHKWSPEQISERLKIKGFRYTISYNTIYRGIYDGLFDEPRISHGNRGAIRKLRHKGKSRHTKITRKEEAKLQLAI